MALVAVTPFLWGCSEFRGIGYASSLIDAVGEKAAFIFQAPKTGTIDRIGFRTGTVTTSDTLDVRLETLDSSGNPSGTLWGTNTNGSQASLASNTFYEVTLTGGASVTQGDLLALVVVQGTVGNLNISGTTGLSGATSGPPYRALYTGTWGKTFQGAAIMSLRYNDTTYPAAPGMYPAATFGTNTFATTSNPDERGNKITVPFACKVNGIWHQASSSTAGDFSLVLYDVSDGVLASVAVDGDTWNVANVGQPSANLFTAEVTLTANQVVRVIKKPTTSTNCSLGDLASPAGMGSQLPLGSAAVHTQRTDAGAWTDVADKQTAIGLIISALDDGAGGSGSTAHAQGFVT